MRRHIWWLAPLAGAAVAGAVVAAVSLGGGSSSHGSPQTSHARLRPAAAALAFQQAITAVVHELSPSVVQIQNSQGLGSGIVFDTNGDIVTNNHVVAGGGPYTVTAGTHSYGASLVGRFAPDDLAILHVSGAKLAPATFADSAGSRSATSRSRSATRWDSARASPKESSAPSGRVSRRGTASRCR